MGVTDGPAETIYSDVPMLRQLNCGSTAAASGWMGASPDLIFTATVFRRQLGIIHARIFPFRFSVIGFGDTLQSPKVHGAR